MREHVRSAIRRRDSRLARIRRLTLWITGGAAAASLGMGTAFAHAQPGHTGSATGANLSAHSAPPAASGSPAAAHHARKHKAARHHQDGLAAPTQPPAPAPAPAPTVTSGGS
jgi:hypothetical protein